MLRRHKLASLLAGLALTATVLPLVQTSPAEATSALKHPTATHIRVAFIPQLIGIPYFTAMQKGGEAAAKALHVTFTYEGPTTASAPGQLSIFDSLVEQHYNAISISVLDPATIDNAFSRALHQGIKVLTTDSDSPNSARLAFVAQASNSALGYTLADELATELHGRGQVGIVSGDATATNLNTWISYIKQRFAAKYPDIKIVKTLYSTTGDQALSDAEDLLSAYPNLSALIAVASSTIPGVNEAVENAHEVGKVKVIGYGSPLTVKSYMEAGVMPISILWNPRNLGYLDVWAMTQLAEGKHFAPENRVPGLPGKYSWNPKTKVLLLGPPLIVTKNNVKNYDF